ncbi:phosphatase PAP2 family protein [Actinoplanes sp. NPDC051633]|uniref:phosphatase PAP2 family protein n=1 Tax=Actinoplanes sp. NPDC051633 TaxID=3155670 RepID=UPI0034342A18
MTALASRPATPPQTRGVGHLITPVLTAVASTLAVVATYRLFVLSSLGQSIDTQALRNSEVGHERATDVMERTLNGTSLAGLVLVCLAVGLIGLIRRRLDLAVAAGVMVLGANLTTRLLKTALPRPELDGFPAPNSFPSGHMAAAASVAFALMLVLPGAIRGAVALIGAGYVSVIAVATVWAEWHRPSDTIAALLIVLAWGAAVAFLLRLWRFRRPGALDRPSRLTTVLFVAGGAIAAAVAAVGLGAVALSERVTPDLVSGRFAFLTGAAAIVAVVAATFFIWMRLSAGEQPAAVPDKEAQS